MQQLAPPVVQNGFPNPRAANNLNGWQAVGSSAVSQAADGYMAATSVDVTVATGTQNAVAIGAPAATYGCPVAGGQLVYGRVAVKHVAAPGSVQYALAISYYNAAGTTLSTQNLHSPLPSRTPGGVWAVIDGFDVAPSGAAFCQLTVTLTSSAGASEFRVTDAQITPDVGWFGVPPECFGDRPGCAWVGAAHASASVGPSGFVNLVPNPQTSQAASGTIGAGQTLAVLPGVEVMGGQEYTARVSATLTSVPVGARCWLRISWLDSTGAVLAESGQADAPIPAAGGEAVCTKAAPPTADQARIDVVGDTAGAYALSFSGNALIADSGAKPTRTWLNGFNDTNPWVQTKSVGEDVRLHQLVGSQCVRFGGGPDEAQPASSSPVRWDGTRWANLLAQCRAAGLRAIPIIGGPPAWMSGVQTTLSGPVSVPGGQGGTAVANVPLSSTAGFLAGGGFATVLCGSGQVVELSYTGVSGSQLTGVTLNAGAQADTAAAGATVYGFANIALLSSSYAQIAAIWAPLVAEFADVVAAIEVWNEPNLTATWNPVSASDYTALLQACYTAVKAVAPQVPVLGGVVNQYSPGNAGSGSDATGTDPGTFVAAMYAAGAKGHMDGVSVHPYSNLSGSGGPPAGNTVGWQAGFFPTLDKVRAQIAAAGDSVPIWVTEVGIPTSSVSDRQQAALLQAWTATLRRQPDVRSGLVHTLFETSLGAPAGDSGVVKWQLWDQRAAFQRLAQAWNRGFVGYFDGSTAGASWSGATNASASVLPQYQQVPLIGQEGVPHARPGRLQLGTRPAITRTPVTLASSAATPAAVKAPQAAKAASSAVTGVSVRQPRPVRVASSATVAAISAGKLVGGLVLTAAVACVATVAKRANAVRAGSTIVVGSVKRAISMLRQAVTALVGFFLPGATPATATVTFTRATYVNVTIGPL